MPSRPAFLKSLLVAVTGGTALLAAGCSTAQHPAASPSPQQAVLLAARQADRAQSVTASFGISVTAGPTDIGMSGVLSERVRPLLAEMNVTRMQVLGSAVPGGMTAIVTGQGFFLRSAELGSVSGGKPWIELRYRDLGRQSGVDLGSLIRQLQNSDPLAQTRLLAGATGVHQVGTGTIDGVAVTEYTGHYTMTGAAGKLPASERKAFRQLVSDAGLSSADFTVWLDGRQQVRKLIVTEHGSVTSLAMTLTVTSINQPVNIHIPPASQVKVLSPGDLSAGS